MSTAQFLPLRFNWKTGLLALGLLLVTSSTVFAHNIEKHFKVEPRSMVTIHNPNGKVVVKAWTKSEIMVIATHTSDKVEVDAEQTGNRVDVMTHQLSASVSPRPNIRDVFVYVTLPDFFACSRMLSDWR